LPNITTHSARVALHFNTMLRRLTGFVTSLLMLQLSFAASDLACARHDGERSPVSSNDAEHHGHASASVHQAADTLDESDSCEIPAQRDCCAALASCGPSMGMLAATRVAQTHAIALRVDVSDTGKPLSLTAAPEPPPPKA
jgi:hypothetical protein